MRTTTSGYSPHWERNSLAGGESTEHTRHKLLTQAERLTTRVRRWAWRRGVALWLGIVVVTLLTLLLLDVILRREEIGLRILSLIALLGAGGWAWLKFVRPAWSLSPTPVQLAQWIERSRPDLGERLSTAIQIAQTDPTEERYGSRGFRNAVLRAWSTEMDQPEWTEYLDTSRAWRAILLAGLLLFLLTTGIVVRPFESRLALTRLFTPWTSQAWPRQDQLEFKDLPSVIGSGSELQLEVIDRNEPLPDNVLISVREAGDPKNEVRTIPTTRLEDVAVGNLPPVERAIEVRATGGDDNQMPWQRIEIVTPPNLKSYQFEIEPPAYTGRAASELVGTRIQVLARSRVKFSAELDEPVKSVQLALAKDTSGSSASTDAAAAAWLPLLADNSQSLVIAGEGGEAAELIESLAWRIELVTRDGLQLELPQRWSIEVIEDAPPTVILNTLTLNQIALDGQLSLKGQAVDDLGLADVTARLQIEGSESLEPVALNLWTNPGSVTPEYLVDTRWDFASSLASQGVDLKEGQVFSVWLEARDQLGQIGRSQIERVEVVSTGNLLAKVQERQNDLLKKMRDLVDAQRRNQQLTERTAKLLQDSQQVSQSETDALAGIAQNQAALSEQLAGQTSSLLDQVAEIESLLELNRLSESPLAEQMDELRRDINAIAEGSMQQAVSAATAAHRESQKQLSQADAIAGELLEQLAESAQRQNDVGNALQTLADRINRTGGLQQIQREFAAINNEQQTLIRNTEALQLEQLRSNRPELLNAPRRELADEQLELAQQLEALLNRTRELSASDRSTNGSGPVENGIVEQLTQATEAITRGEVSRLMRQAAEETNAQQLSNALELERQAAQVLADALRRIDPARSQSRTGDLKQMAEDLQATGGALSELARSQAQLAEQMRQPNSANRAAELGEEQALLSEQTEQQSDQAEANGQQSAAEALQNTVAEQMAAEEAASQQQMQTAADAAERAADQLNDLAEDFQQRADELERQSKQQELYRLEVALSGLLAQQTPLVERLNKLAELQSAGNEVTAQEPTQNQTEANQTEANQAGARQAAVDQEAVRLALLEVRQQTQQLATFDWTLQQTGLDMARAVAAAQRYRIAPEAVNAANDALKKLQLANEAISTQQPAPDEAEPTEEQSNADESEAQEGKQQLLPPVASLKLLRGLQNEINQQTQLLDVEPDANRKQRRLRELSDQQQALGKQLEALLESLATDPDGN